MLAPVLCEDVPRRCLSKLASENDASLPSHTVLATYLASLHQRPLPSLSRYCSLVLAFARDNLQGLGPQVYLSGVMYAWGGVWAMMNSVSIPSFAGPR